MVLNIIIALFYVLAGYYLVRASYVLLGSALKKDKAQKKSMMLIFGSGGHTTELLMTFKNFDFNQWKNIYFVKAETDTTSENKIRDYVKTNRVKIDLDKVTWITIPRSREVGQSYITSVFTTLKSLIYTYIKLTKLGTIDLTVCNGPGTCVPVVFVILLNRILLLTEKVRIIFVESYCRVTSLSLTGKILYPVVDRFLVHWPELVSKYKKARYLGTII